MFKFKQQRDNKFVNLFELPKKKMRLPGEKLKPGPAAAPINDQKSSMYKITPHEQSK